MVKPVKGKDARDLGNEEIKSKLASLKDELFNLRFQLATNQLDNPLRIREVRRDIARLKTVMRERELAAERELKAQA